MPHPPPRALRSLLPVACIAGLALASLPAVAQQLYRWTDGNGIHHYGDRRPGAAQPRSRPQPRPTRAVPAPAPPRHAVAGALARLRIERAGGGYRVWADNQLAGPIEVMLDFKRRGNVRAAPRLPARTTVAALDSGLVAVLSPVDPGRATSFELRMRSLPGMPGADPRDVVYMPPLRQVRLQVEQGYGGGFSHDDAQNLYAIDFAAAVGTPVLAARGGLVMQVAADFERAGLSREILGGRANFIRILHGDGSMALYAHLKPDGVRVHVGQRVRAGEQIGLSGNTGYTTGPHLHFAVQVNRGMRLQSVPFRMRGLQTSSAGR